MKSIINTVIICVSVVVCVCIFSAKIVESKIAQSNTIVVTGSATESFVSDLIVWRGYFLRKDFTTKKAYDELKSDAAAVKKYLIDNGIKEEDIIFSSVETSEQSKYEYNEKGYPAKTIFDGYRLSQSVSITSKDVDNVERISRDITELIDLGVDFSSSRPEYYYTKLDELKLDLIAKSAENTKLRAETIVKESGAEISKLRTASLGVFQITAENSSTDGYSYAGSFDVRSKNKTAFITTRLEYLLK